jgi:hypothetical protein
MTRMSPVTFSIKLETGFHLSPKLCRKIHNVKRYQMFSWFGSFMCIGNRGFSVFRNLFVDSCQSF